MSEMPACRNGIEEIWEQNHNRLDCAAHAGLVLSVCLRRQDSPDHTRELFSQACNAVESAKSVYGKAFRRWKASLRAAGYVSKAKDLYIQGRLLIGAGSDSVLETGLTLHHTYGTPVIPGSALKGVASHYCDQVWGIAAENEGFMEPSRQMEGDGRESEVKGEFYRVIFGAPDYAGHFIFHDAWITPETVSNSLHRDIMTPHHPDYYTHSDKTNLSAPSDFDDPRPLSFLSLGSGGVFHVAVTCDIPGEEGSKWMDLVFELLEQALEHWGVGAKTNAGYGRLQKGPVSTSALPSGRRPVESRKAYKRGDRIKVKRLETPPGKKYLLFEASDGTQCQVLQMDDPCANVQTGHEIELWVMNVSPRMYTLSSKQPKKKAPAKVKKGRPK